MLAITEKNNVVLFSIKVHPGANQSAVTGAHDGALKIKVSQKPEGGAANQACIKLLAKVIMVKLAQIEIVKGQTSRKKIIKISGINKEQLLMRLDPIIHKGVG